MTIPTRIDRLTVPFLLALVFTGWAATQARAFGRFEVKFDRVIERLDRLDAGAERAASLAQKAYERNLELQAALDHLRERIDEGDRRRHAEWIYVHGRIDNHKWHPPTEQEN